ncbi:hypothetical protein IU486_19610 [Streptomyces gardneri]|uniref:hypothetical protein n=1 Tax=Nocardia abscessus TaxID=120957 RepID=UPI0018963391|nr:hypothetical protein [Nocardia abscessus]MBF6166942.1 hypothetical protein [Streptomyces gardneri]MBF6221688.1 hypothetical protein [Nocardia abscessus]MBF6475366.1 hypothetical protein [Nocardia abscessus]
MLIEDGKIAQVGPDLDADTVALDCVGKVVLPGFVIAHHDTSRPKISAAKS